MPHTINLAEKFALFNVHWSPKIIGTVGDMHIKLVKLHGDFLWHSHETEDEMFLVTKGRMTMKFRDREAIVNPGECIIIPHGVEHMPCCDEETFVMLIEPASTVNTGDTLSDRTRTPDII